MKARVREYVSGRYGKPGEYIVRLQKPEYFKNGKLNKAETLRNGYVVLETIREAYGWGAHYETIVDFWEEEDE